MWGLRGRWKPGWGEADLGQGLHPLGIGLRQAPRPHNASQLFLRTQSCTLFSERAPQLIRDELYATYLSAKYPASGGKNQLSTHCTPSLFYPHVYSSTSQPTELESQDRLSESASAGAPQSGVGGDTLQPVPTAEDNPSLPDLPSFLMCQQEPGVPHQNPHQLHPKSRQ